MFNMLVKPLKLDLRTFDGGAGGAGAGGGSGAAAPGTGGSAESNNKPGSSQQATQGEKVVYGKQDSGAEAGAQQSSTGSQSQQQPTGSDTQGQQSNLTPEERKAQFDQMISGDFKDLFGERVQSIIDRRFRDTKVLENRFGSLQPALDLLMSRYNVQSEGDLVNAIMKDDVYLEDAADQAGMSVEQYRNFLRMNAENRRLQAQVQDQEARRNAEMQFNKWNDEAMKLRGSTTAPGLYPNFDLNVEAQNPQFKSVLDSLTRSGFPDPVKVAYETVHMDEIKNGIAANTAKRVETNVTENIRAKGSRPPENGVNNQSGVIVKSDVHQLSREDRKAIAQRAARGENIRF